MPEVKLYFEMMNDWPGRPPYWGVRGFRNGSMIFLSSADDLATALSIAQEYMQEQGYA